MFLLIILILLINVYTYISIKRVEKRFIAWNKIQSVLKAYLTNEKYEFSLFASL